MRSLTRAVYPHIRLYVAEVGPGSLKELAFGL